MSTNNKIFMHVIPILNTHENFIMSLHMLGLKEKIDNPGTNIVEKYEITT